MSTVEEPIIRTSAQLAEHVLIVENNYHVWEELSLALKRENIPYTVAEPIANAEEQLRQLVSEKVRSLVIVLDLMFEKRRADEGLAFLGTASKYAGFQREEINAIIFSALNDQQTKERAFAGGAKRFHAKSGRGYGSILEDIRYFLRRPVKTITSQVEVVDIDDLQQEAEVRYQLSEDTWIRCKLSYDEVPALARVTGGSFYFDIYKEFTPGKPNKTWSQSRMVDPDEDRRKLSELLGS